MARVAIFGIGNVLLGDDGVGPFVARCLEERGLPDEVLVEDLGTPSLDLPGYMTGHDAVVFVDAVAGPGDPGSIHIYSRDEIVAVEPGIRISPHEPSIPDALRVLDFAGWGPATVTLVGVVPQTLEGGVELSPPVLAAVPKVVDVILGIASKC
jgi:hydrogenase maturation protease